MKKLGIATISLLLAAFAAVAEPVTIEVWYALSGQSGESFKRVVEDFAASPANADIKVKATFSGGYADTGTKIAAALLSGTEPNVLIGGNVAYTGARGNFYVGDKVNSSPEFRKSDVYEGLWDYAVYHDRICSIPYGISTPLMFYNKKIVEKAGIDLANPPKTWTDFAKVAKRAQAGGKINESKEFWGFVVKDVPWLFKTQLSQNGNEVFVADKDFNVKAIFDDEGAAAVCQWWADMSDAKIMPVGQNGNAEAVFLAGNAAFFVGSSTKIADWSMSMGDTLGAIPMPYFSKPSVALGGNTLAIFPKKKGADEAAWKFVLYITSAAPNAQFALGSGYLPIRKSALELASVKKALKDVPMYKAAFAQLDYCWSYINIDAFMALDGAIRGAVENVQNHRKPARQCMIDAVKEYNIEAGK